MFQFDVVTLFPEMFDAITGSGVIGRARERKLFELVLWNPRSFAANSYRTVDDRPYGGGPGMVMMAEPLEKSIQAARQRQMSAGAKQGRTVYLSPQGRPLDHRRVMEYAGLQGLVLLAGRYEGVDERLIARAVDEEVSLGDYVLTGGELAAMVVMDVVVRQMPGALATRTRRGRIRSPTGCSIARTTRAPRSTRARRCRRCCSRATTRRSRGGG